MTIEEIANELGVSKSTVSRALSGKGRIGKATIERIQAMSQRKIICRTNMEKRRRMTRRNW